MSELWVSVEGRSGALGTQNDPVRTIQEALDRATPGTTINVKAGTYNENLKISHSGTGTAPISILSVDGRGMAEVRPHAATVDTIRISGADNVTLDGMKIHGPALANTVHLTSLDNKTNLPENIIIKNCDIYPDGGDGIKVSQGGNITITNNRVVGSVHEQGIDLVGVIGARITHNEVSSVQGGAAIQVKGGSSDIVISDNYIHDVARWGILVGGSTSQQDVLPEVLGSPLPYEIKSVFVSGNIVTNTGQQAIRVMGAQEVNVTDNWISKVASSRVVDVVSSEVTHEPWASGSVSFQNNSFDRANWLTVESGDVQLSGNRTDGVAPVDEMDAGIETQTPPAPEPQTPPAQLPEVADPVDPPFVGDGSRNLITGNERNNVLLGNGGNDTLEGGAGDDILEGGAGRDRLFGGQGADSFVFAKPSDSPVGSRYDIIYDWDVQDRIDLSRMTDLTDMDIEHYRGNTWIIGKVGADSTPDFQICILGVHDLAADDFVI